jgi:hypothetical protein
MDNGALVMWLIGLGSLLLAIIIGIYVLLRDVPTKTELNLLADYGRKFPRRRR